MERLYASFARQIEKAVKDEISKKIPGKVQSLFSQLEKELKDERPSFELFKERFADIEYGPSQRSRDLVKYILNKINNYDQTGEHLIDFDVVNIEHVLPQSPSKKWNLTKKEIKDYVNKLGNLTLVLKTFNSKVGNKIISEKIDEYEKSQIAMTQKLVLQLKDLGYKWGEEQINQRHDNFASLAYYKVWSY